MFKITIFLLLFFATKQSWTLSTCSPSKIIELNQIDYTTQPVITSDIPRSNLSSSLLNYNWADITPELARLNDIYKPSVDLSASVPDYLPPNFVLDALSIVAHNRSDSDSYTIHQESAFKNSRGHPRLLRIIASYFSNLMGRTLDPQKEILVTIGASNALDLAARAFLNPGEEAILFEPAYSMLISSIENAYGKPVFVPLIVKSGTTGEQSNDWTFDPKELESNINPKTKLIMLNNPVNPNGKAFTLDELIFIGNLAEKYNLVIVSDEATITYQYDKPGPIHIASLRQFYKRTVTIYSGGKMLSNLGWKVGWVIGPDEMLWGMTAISAESIYSVPVPLQIAYAMALETENKVYNTSDSYVKQLNDMSLKSRNKLVSILKSVGAETIVPSAGYSLVVNFTQIADQIDLSSEKDCRPGMRFLTFLLKKGIAINPTSLYYGPQNIWRTEYVVRITNVKTEKTIDEFERILKTIFKTIK